MDTLTPFHDLKATIRHPKDWRYARALLAAAAIVLIGLGLVRLLEPAPDKELSAVHHLLIGTGPEAEIKTVEGRVTVTKDKVRVDGPRGSSWIPTHGRRVVVMSN